MVERRCRATLLAQTEGDASPLPARNEVNPRTELAQASWALPGKDQVHSVETAHDPMTFSSKSYLYTSFGMLLNIQRKNVSYLYIAREHEYYYIMSHRIRAYDSTYSRFLSMDPVKYYPDYMYVFNNPLFKNDPAELSPRRECSYYDERCKNSNCEKDEYACEAGSCCRDFSENKKENCGRNCLIKYDKENCIQEKGGKRRLCRVKALFKCYVSCKFIPKRIPKSCLDIIGG